MCVCFLVQMAQDDESHEHKESASWLSLPVLCSLRCALNKLLDLPLPSGCLMIYYLFNARRRRQISLWLHFGRIMASDKNRSGR